jgi:hypothetical protein
VQERLAQAGELVRWLGAQALSQAELVSLLSAWALLSRPRSNAAELIAELGEVLTHVRIAAELPCLCHGCGHERAAHAEGRCAGALEAPFDAPCECARYVDCIACYGN